MVIETLCESAICVSDASWSASLDVEVLADRVLVLFIEVVSATVASAAQSRDALEGDPATVEHSEDPCTRSGVIHNVAELELKQELCFSWYARIEQEHLLLVVGCSVASTVEHNQVLLFLP